MMKPFEMKPFDAKAFEEMQKVSQANMDAAMKMWAEWGKSWQALAAEMTDYTKRSFEDGTATFEKLVSAKSLEQAFEIQTGYAKRSYDEYMHQVSKVGNMFASLAKDAYRPVERAMQGATR
jgi:hypothetical protein